MGTAHVGEGAVGEARVDLGEDRRDDGAGADAHAAAVADARVHERDECAVRRIGGVGGGVGGGVVRGGRRDSEGRPRPR